LYDILKVNKTTGQTMWEVSTLGGGDTVLNPDGVIQLYRSSTVAKYDTEGNLIVEVSDIDKEVSENWSTVVSDPGIVDSFPHKW
jgi:hypothetical protein